eukprot:236633_1
MISIVSSFFLALAWITSLCAGVLAYRIRHTRPWIRWTIGVVTLKMTQHTQNYSHNEWRQILPVFVTDPQISLYWIVFTVSVCMMWANAWCIFFGGTQYCRKHGIDSYRKAMIVSICPGQMYFRDNKHSRRKAVSNLIRIGIVFCVGSVVSLFVRSIDQTLIEFNVLVHMEVLGLLFSAALFLANIPANLHYLLWSNDDMEVIEPYDLAYFSESIRSFWKNWSRPGGELFRYMFYLPLGGRDRYWASVSMVFLANCTCHYDFSMNMYGYRAMYEWNIAYLIMGTSIVFFIFTENLFLTR